jgi:hypothetical protein
LHIKEAGYYEIQLEYWEDWEKYSNQHETNYYGDYWEVYVFDDCALDNHVVVSLGHVPNRGRAAFTATANTEYYILVDNWGDDHYNTPIIRTWKVVKTEAPKGFLNITLKNEQNGSVTINQETKVLVYSKADILTTFYNAEYPAGNNAFRAEIPFGEYIVYAEKVPGFLPTWYDQAAHWSNAATVTFDEKSATQISLKLLKVPQLPSGNISISGAVKTTGGETMKDVSVNIYKSKNQTSNAPANLRTVNKVSQVDVNVWELAAVAKTNASGNYSFSNLPEGEYLVVVDLAGYAVNEDATVSASGSGGYSINFEADEVNHTISASPTGLKHINAPELRIYPNPTKGELRIENGELRIEKVEIYDILGKKLSTFNFQLSTNQIDISQLPKGIYFVKLKTDKGELTRKVIKE